MSLFDHLPFEKRRDEILPVGMQPCTQLLYFTMDERTEFQALVKKGIKEKLGEEANKGNISDFILDLLKEQYG